ncbi:Vesicle-associated membrane protein/synaptobrevin-binding protein [Halotydeus destructor]|nr:Vesicle-associated membrane protein/synaptobrevin-binding protein [Halotydeus destructor]
MSKSDQVLQLDPKAELRFKGPFTEVVTSYLKLTNPSERRVCFKVKTTAPKRYCVRPNNGLVEPKGQAQIAVMLQPFDVENQAEKNKHKFMVQTMFAPDGDVNQDTLWKEASPDSVMDSKLKCVFDVPAGSKQDETVQQLATSTTSASSAVDSDIGDHYEKAKAPESQSARPPSSPNAKQVQAKAPEALNSASATSDVRKVNDENRRLREELTSIRQENMQLKEEGLKQRIRHGASSGTSGSAGTTADLLSKQKMASGQDSPQDVAQLMMNPNVLAIAVVLFIVGIILGKVIF